MRKHERGGGSEGARERGREGGREGGRYTEQAEATATSETVVWNTRD